jgi:hypothetical protein
MTTSATVARTEVLAAFFKRFEVMESILRIITSHARLRALLTMRGEPEKTVLLDLSSSPAQLMCDEQARDVDVLVTARDEIWHDMLSNRLPAGEALGRRELLLKGSASHLASLIPLFDFGPVLYRDHIEKAHLRGPRLQPGPSDSKELSMDTPTFKGDPVPLVQLSPIEKLLFGMLSGLSYAMGYCVGFLRYRLFKNLDLFDILSAMSRGLGAATPQQKGN